MPYTAKNLEDIARAFDHFAWQATAFADRLHKTQRAKLLALRESQTWKQAAQQLRETTLDGLDAIRAVLDFASDAFEKETSLGEDMSKENEMLDRAYKAFEQLKGKP